MKKTLAILLFILGLTSFSFSQSQSPSTNLSYDVDATHLIQPAFNIAGRGTSAHIFTWSVQRGALTSCTLAFQTAQNAGGPWTTQSTGDCTIGGTTNYLVYVTNFFRINATTFIQQGVITNSIITVNYAGYVIAPTSIATITTTGNLNNLQSINSIIYAYNYTGANLGIKLAAVFADSTIPVTGATVIISPGTSSTQVIASDIFSGVTKSFDLVFAPGNYSFTSTVNFGYNISVQAGQGAIFSVATTKVVTFKGAFDANLSQHFTLNGTGIFKFGPGKIHTIHAQWWGAKENAVDHDLSSVTNGSATLTCPDCGFTADDVGKIIHAYGALSTGTGNLVGTISAFLTSTTVTLSVTPTVTVTGSLVMTYGDDDAPYIQLALNSICNTNDFINLGGELDVVTGTSFVSNVTIDCPNITIRGHGIHSSQWRKSAYDNSSMVKYTTGNYGSHLINHMYMQMVGPNDATHTDKVLEIIGSTNDFMISENWFAGSYSAVELNGTDNIGLVNNQFESCEVYCIHALQTSLSKFTGNTFYNVAANANYSSGAAIKCEKSVGAPYSPAGVSVASNYFYLSNYGAFLDLDGCVGWTISSNFLFIASAQSAVNGTKDDIYLANSDYVTIQGNTSFDFNNPHGAFRGSRYVVNIQASNNHVKLNGNAFKPGVTGTINNLAGNKVQFVNSTDTTNSSLLGLTVTDNGISVTNATGSNDNGATNSVIFISAPTNKQELIVGNGVSASSWFLGRQANSDSISLGFVSDSGTGESMILKPGANHEWCHANGVCEFSGSGTPEGAITAVKGSSFKRTDGGSGTGFYVKESGTGNTGWVAK